MVETSYPKLSKPPIHEAVLDIRVLARSGFGAEDLRPLKDALRAHFPTAEAMFATEATFLFEKGAVAKADATEAKEVGVLFRSADGKLILQTRVDGITLSRLSPYVSFDELTPTLMDCWSRYVEAARPSQATRLAVRYINRFDVPSRGTLNEYLTHPPVPVLSEMGVVAFMHRDFMRTVDRRSAASVTTALEPGMDERSTSIVVDIDAFCDDRPVRLEGRAASASAEEISSVFGELRDLKNRFFFSLLTQSCIEQFK